MYFVEVMYKQTPFRLSSSYFGTWDDPFYQLPESYSVVGSSSPWADFYFFNKSEKFILEKLLSARTGQFKTSEMGGSIRAQRAFWASTSYSYFIEIISSTNKNLYFLSFPIIE